MPVKTTAEAIFGAIVVFHLAGLCQAEVLMVTLRWAHRGTELLCFHLLTAVFNARYKYDPRRIHDVVL